MFCEICKKKITSRRNLFNLFERQIHHICEYCFQKYPLIIKKSFIPIDGGEMIWASMIQTYDDISPLAHMSFYKPFIIDFIKNYHQSILLVYDQLNDEIMDLLEKVKLGDIYLLSLYDMIEKKGELLWNLKS